MGALDCVSNRVTISGTPSTEVFTINLSSSSTLNDSKRDLESQHSKAYPRPRRLWWTVAVDIPLFVTVSSLIGLYELGVFPSYKAGFFCNDPELSYPFTGDTVSMKVLVSTVFLLPFGMIWVTELIFIDVDETFRTKLNIAFFKTLWLYRSYLYGLFFNLTLVEVMKGITGRPRPTFFAICEPDAAKTCNGSEFISTFECTSTQFSAWFQKDSYHSFPSGHSSLSVYCGFFLAWYLQKRAFSWRHRTIILVPVLQLCAISFSVLSSLTRITDHRHHWWDVLAGVMIGFATVFYAVAVLCDNFSISKSRCLNENSLEDSRPSVKSLVSDGKRGDTSP